MKIRLLWVGKTKEGWASEAIEKYLKLLRHFAEVEVVQIKEEKARSAKGASAEREAVNKALSVEGKRILEKVSSSYILLDERGAQKDSVELAGMLKDTARMEFVLGGPWGVSDEVKSRAHKKLALSTMTLTHDLARVLFLEQLYRGFTINSGRGYHH